MSSKLSRNNSFPKSTRKTCSSPGSTRLIWRQIERQDDLAKSPENQVAKISEKTKDVCKLSKSIQRPKPLYVLFSMMPLQWTKHLPWKDYKVFKLRRTSWQQRCMPHSLADWDLNVASSVIESWVQPPRTESILCHAQTDGKAGRMLATKAQLQTEVLKTRAAVLRRLPTLRHSSQILTRDLTAVADTVQQT